MHFLSILIFFLLLSNYALAYIGPGLGLGVVLSILGLIFSVLLFILAIIWYPLKKILMKKKVL